MYPWKHNVILSIAIHSSNHYHWAQLNASRLGTHLRSWLNHKYHNRCWWCQTSDSLFLLLNEMFADFVSNLTSNCPTVLRIRAPFNLSVGHSRMTGTYKTKERECIFSKYLLHAIFNYSFQYLDSDTECEDICTRQNDPLNTQNSPLWRKPSCTFYKSSLAIKCCYTRLQSPPPSLQSVPTHASVSTSTLSEYFGVNIMTQRHTNLLTIKS